MSGEKKGGGGFARDGYNPSKVMGGEFQVMD